MRDSDHSKALTVHDSIQQSNLLQLATPEMLAVSKPPASFPVPRTAKASCIVPALHEIETLRRERVSLKEQVGQGTHIPRLQCLDVDSATALLLCLQAVERVFLKGLV